MTDIDTPESTEAQHPLVGRFFHTTRECPHGVRAAVWQGRIIAAVTADVLLIELCEWIVGEPSGQELITLADFMAKDPVLYSDAEWMRFSFEHGAMRHRCDEQSDE
jgi:hypothetical protein